MKHSFGIIICTYNRCDCLKDTLKSLIRQECDGGPLAEIIIVDNNSTDGTEKLVHSYMGSFKTKLKYIKEEKQGKSQALNRGIKESRSDVLIFTDDDVILDTHWLNEIIHFFETNDVDVLGGRVLPIYPPHTPEWVKKNEHQLRGPIGIFDNGEDVIDYKSGKISEFPGANVVYKKSVFETVGFYNTALSPENGTFFEDIEMFQRAVRAGKKIFYNGKVSVGHKNQKKLTLRYIAEWNFKLGKSSVLLEPLKPMQKLPSINGCGVIYIEALF